MATVYLARDLKHDRQVALKVLRQDVEATQGEERFQREIKIAAALRHPHIIPLYDSGVVDDRHYFVMPFTEGESLRNRLTRETRLSLKVALRIGYEVADALSYAHSRGVVHRDIKPENILLESGHALVADFGIALAMHHTASHPATDARMTGAGLAVGTPPYMSPEQAAADPEIDERTDIYSLGCVLYEMLTGEAPFPGETWEAIALQRVSEPAPNVSARRPDIPRPVSDLVARAMTLSPDDRFPTASQLAEALDVANRIAVTLNASAAARSGERSIAVLPFDNLSPDAENEYFADGMAEDIIDALTQLEGLRVVPRTSTFAFKGRQDDLRAIAAALAVETVLTGSVRRAGNRLRITAQLVDVSDGYQLWSERYERELTDVFAIQDEIAKAIALRLRVMLGKSEQRLVKPPTDSLEAYELYLQGRALLVQRGLNIREAVGRLEAALAHDPDFALAHAALAEGLALLAFYGIARPNTIAHKAKNSSSRAVELGPHLAEAHMAQAICAFMFDFDRATAVVEFERAHAIEPKNVVVMSHRLTFLHQVARARPVDAVREGELAIGLDPLNSTVLSRLSNAHMTLGQHDQAIRWARRAIEVDPGSLLSQSALVMALGASGDSAAATRAAEESLAQSGRHPWMLSFLATVLDHAEDRDGAAAIHHELSARSGREYVQPGVLAITSASCGMLDEAIEHCITAIDERDAVVLFFLHAGFPFSRRIRASSRFAEVRARIGWDQPRSG